jgi:hypothetical protein
MGILAAPRECRPQIVDLGLRPQQQLLIGGVTLGFKLGNRGRVVVAVSGADLVPLAGFAELFLRVLAHRLEQPVAHAVSGVVGDHEGFVDQQAELIQQLVALHFAAGTDGMGSVQIEPAGEYCQAAEQDSLRFGEQRVRPIHRHAQRLLAPHRSTRTAGQQPEPIMQTVGDLAQRECPNPCSGKFNRQRHTIQALTDLRHQCVVVLAHNEIRACPPSTIGEQLHGLVVNRQRRHPPTQLTGHPERFTTGSQYGQVRARVQQLHNHAPARVEQMLAVVEQQQHGFVADEPYQRVHGGAARLIGQTQRARCRDRHHRRIGDRR